MYDWINILKHADWETKVKEYFKRDIEDILKTVLDISLGENSKTYFINLVIYSFVKEKLVHFQVMKGIAPEIFYYLPAQLREFSFSTAIVENELNKTIYFNNKDKDVNKWDNYFPKNATEKDEKISEKKDSLKESHKLSVTNILEGGGIDQVSFIPLITGSTIKKVGGVCAINSSILIGPELLDIFQKVISGIVSSISIQELEFLSLQANRKAAISQVMLRNLSHNHGSHVLSRMIHPDQINESQNKMHEGIRYILSKKYCG